MSNTGATYWTSAASTGTGQSWSTPSNALTSNSSYSTATGSWSLSKGTSAFLTLTGIDLSALPTSAVIVGIIVGVKKFGSNAAIKDLNLQLLDNGTAVGNNKADTTSAWPTTNTLVTYGSSSDLWGYSWTRALLQTVGVQFSVQSLYSGLSNYTADVDSIYIDVYYTSDTYIDAPVYSLTVSVPLPTISGGTSVDVPAKSLTLTGNAPTPQMVIPVPAKSLTLTAYAPDRPATNTIVSVPVSALTLTGEAPSIATGTTVDVPAASLTLSALIPNLQYAILSPAASLTLTGNAPDLQLIVLPPIKALTLTGKTPAINTGTSIDAPVSSLTLSADVPDLQFAIGVPAANLILTKLSPLTQLIVFPPAATLSISGNAPDVDIVMNVPLSTFAITGNTPAIATGTSVDVPVAGLSLAKYSPGLSFSIGIPAGALSLSAIVPAIVSDLYIDIPAANLSLTTQAPAISLGAIVLVPNLALSMSTYTPDFPKIIDVPVTDFVLDNTNVPSIYWQYPPKCPLPVYDWQFNATAGSTTKTITDNMGRVNLTISDEAVLQTKENVVLSQPYSNGYCWTGHSLILNKDAAKGKVYFKSDDELVLLKDNDFTIVVFKGYPPDINSTDPYTFGLHNNGFQSVESGNSPAVPSYQQASSYMILDPYMSDGTQSHKVGSNADAYPYSDIVAYVYSKNIYNDFYLFDGASFGDHPQAKTGVFRRYVNYPYSPTGGFSYIDTFALFTAKYDSSFRFYSGDLRTGSTNSAESGVTEYRRIMIFNRALTPMELDELVINFEQFGVITKSPGITTPIASLYDWDFNEAAGDAIDSISGVHIAAGGTTTNSGTSFDVGAAGSIAATNGIAGQLDSYTIILTFNIPSNSSGYILSLGDGTSAIDASKISFYVQATSHGIRVTWSDGFDLTYSTFVYQPNNTTGDVCMVIAAQNGRGSVYVTGDGKNWFGQSNYSLWRVFNSNTFELRSAPDGGNAVANLKYKHLTVWNGVLPAHDFYTWLASVGFTEGATGQYTINPDLPYATGSVQELIGNVVADSQITALLNLVHNMQVANSEVSADANLRQRLFTQLDVMYNNDGVYSYLSSEGPTIQPSMNGAKLVSNNYNGALTAHTPEV